jgi:CAAX prenyl protease-like protein
MDERRDGFARDLVRWTSSAAFLRTLPFALLLVFVAASAILPPPEPVAVDRFDSRWIYAARALVVGMVLVALWGKFAELHTSARMALADWVLALASGAAVFVIWIHLDHGWAVLGGSGSSGFDPRHFASEDLHLPLTALRLVGLAIVVPIAEELFWRSFLLRWLERQDFLKVAPRVVGVRALAITSVLFGLEHTQWLAGLIAGAVYGLVYMRTEKLWVPIVSHALTNAMLGAWILAMRDWRFW